MRYICTALAFWGLAFSLTGQTWRDTDIYDIRGDRKLAPKTARGLTADTDALRTILWAAPHESATTAEASPTTLLLPTPDGKTATFSITAYDATEAPSRYPNIRTWYGLNTSDLHQTIFLDWTEQGFHASIRGGESPSWYIDPVVSGDLKHYQAYYRKDLTDNAPAFDCSTKMDDLPGLIETESTDKSAGDCILRQYRVAITATPQYSNYHGAFTGIQSGLVQSAIVTTVNRINQLYTHDLSIRFTKYSGAPEPGPELRGPSGLQPDIRTTLLVRNTVTELYQFQVSAREDFSELMYDETTDKPSFTLPAYLSPNSRYFWRARTRDANGDCGISLWTSTDFISGDCPTFTTTSDPVEISTGPPIQNAEMSLNIPVQGEIIDIDLVLLDLEHSYLNDVEVDLESPSGTIVTIFDRSCGGNDNILLNFDDESTISDFFCPPVNANAFVKPPGEGLGAFDGQELLGVWTLKVRDRANQDGGQINGFSLKACLDQPALPVTWSSFTATGRKTDILLEWSTISEENNEGFYVERAPRLSRGFRYTSPATAPTNWQEMGFVAANQGQTYAFIDNTAQPNTDYFFRLRQTDQDGRVNYSEIRSARIGSTATDGLHLFPNPTTDRISYRWTTPEETRSNRKYALTDAQGRLLREGQLLSSGGLLNLETLPAGVYFLRIPGLEVLRVVRL